MNQQAARRQRVTVPKLRERKHGGPRITMVTAYDYTFARMLDEAGVDALLVGDSLGMVVQGRADTLGVTVDEMVYHCRAVSRGAEAAHVVGDMPFLSYQVSPEEALRNAGRLVAEGGAHAVKLEGGEPVLEAVRRIVRAGIPVMGHLGLTPQSVHAMGGFKVQGREQAAAERIVAEAKMLEEAGVYALVLEGVPAPLAERVTAEVGVPTIGIGAGVGCDGQVLVCYDLLGLTAGRTPRFVKRYAEWFREGAEAVGRYVREVREGRFPGPEHSFGLKSLRYGGEEGRAAEPPEATA